MRSHKILKECMDHTQSQKYDVPELEKYKGEKQTVKETKCTNYQITVLPTGLVLTKEDGSSKLDTWNMFKVWL
jgi:hypothetical protein